jgi:hypothetical protein
MRILPLMDQSTKRTSDDCREQPRDFTSIIELRSGMPGQMLDQAEQVKEIPFAEVHRTTRPSSSAQFCTMTIGKSSLFSTIRNRCPSGATSSR